MSFAGSQQNQGFFGSMLNGSPSSFTSPPINPQALAALSTLENAGQSGSASPPQAMAQPAQPPGASPQPGQPSPIMAALQKLRMTNPQAFQALLMQLKQRMMMQQQAPQMPQPAGGAAPAGMPGQ